MRNILVIAPSWVGDAVMASFPTLEEAVRASVAMVHAHDEAFAAHALHVKIGVHAGPGSLVVGLQWTL